MRIATPFRTASFCIRRTSFLNGLVNVEAHLLGIGFLYERSNARDHLACPIAIADNAAHGVARFIEVWGRRGKPAQRGIGVCDDGGERLVDFMRNRRGHLAQSCHARNVGELHLCMVQRIFGALALDELTYLAAYGSHHVEQILIGLPDLVAEELHDPQNFAAEQDGKTEGRVQHFARGDGRARKISITDDIGNV